MRFAIALLSFTLAAVLASVGVEANKNIASGPELQDVVIFSNGNIYTVYNQPQVPTRFRLGEVMVITMIQDYHWNNGRGTRPGTIALRDSAGRTYGPWKAVGSPGQGGVPNAYWTVSPSIKLGPGEYTIIDSEPSTWAQNSGSGRAGMTIVKGYRPKSATPTPTATPGPSSGKVYALTENRARHNVLIWVAGKEPKTAMDVLNYHLEPGWKGSLPVTIPADGKIKFVAGTGGAGPGSMYDKVITTCVWTGDPRNTNRFPHIIFEAGGSLTCSTATKK